MKGWHDKAIEEFKLARANAPNIATLVPLGYEYARAGDLAASTEYLTQLLDLAGKQNEYVPAIYLAVVYIGRGDKDKALTWLAKADQERCDYIVFLSRDPMVDSLRGEPRFETLVRPRSQ
jgi:Flp pilus assembly protein TadD